MLVIICSEMANVIQLENTEPMEEDVEVETITKIRTSHEVRITQTTDSENTQLEAAVQRDGARPTTSREFMNRGSYQPFHYTQVSPAEKTTPTSSAENSAKTENQLDLTQNTQVQPPQRIRVLGIDYKYGVKRIEAFNPKSLPNNPEPQTAK